MCDKTYENSMSSIHQQQSSSGDDETRGELPDAGASPTSEALAQRVAELESELAQERHARVRAESANRAKDEFLSIVSHELRSPLNAILGWNRILSIKRAQDAEVVSVTPRIEQSARAQLKMVNDLLDFGRIGTGKLRLAPRPLKLSALASMAVEAARPAAEAKGLQLALEPGPSGPVVGDPDRLLQVIGNLLSNATKFTQRPGRITVRIREPDSRVELRVIDTGQGITPELLPHIFDRFTQGDSSTRRTSGLGLGLTLAREIVALHGGSITAESAGADQGSTFTVSLAATLSVPTASENPIATAVHGKRAPQLTGLSILVVDDEADARAVVAEALRLEGARVTTGDSVRAALAQLVEPGRHFDVLVTDIGMPDEDGYSLVRKLRQLSAGENLVAIAVTGFASRGDIETAINAGFDLHVPKPVDFDSFVPIIRRMATRQN
jgi:signal transduction histidine kinase/ActR/RegA family two-component response regulator